MFARPIDGVERLSGTNRLRHILFGFSVLIAVLCYYMLFDFKSSESHALSGEILTSHSPIYQATHESGVRAFLFNYFGFYTYILPLYLIFLGYIAFYKDYSLKNIDLFKVGLVILGFNCLTIGLSSLFSFIGTNEFSGQGGILGDFLIMLFTKVSTSWLAPLISIAVSFAGICMFFITGPLALAENIGALFSRYVLGQADSMQGGMQGIFSSIKKKGLSGAARLRGRGRAATPRPFNLSESHFDQNHVFKNDDAKELQMRAEAAQDSKAPAAQGPRGYFGRTEPTFDGEPTLSQPEPQFQPPQDAQPQQQEMRQEQEAAQEEYEQPQQPPRERNLQQARFEVPQELFTQSQGQQFQSHARYEEEAEEAPESDAPATIVSYQNQPQAAEEDDRESTIITRGDLTKRPLYGNEDQSVAVQAEAEPSDPVDDRPATIITRSGDKEVSSEDGLNCFRRKAEEEPAEQAQPQEQVQAQTQDAYQAEEPVQQQAAEPQGALEQAEPPAHAEEPAVQENVIRFTQEQEEPVRGASFEINEGALPSAFIPGSKVEHAEPERQADARSQERKAAPRDSNALDRNTNLISEKDSNYNYASASRGVIAEHKEEPAAEVRQPVQQEAQQDPQAVYVQRTAETQAQPQPVPVQPQAAAPQPQAVPAQAAAPAESQSMISAPVHKYGRNRPSVGLLTPSTDEVHIDTQMFLDVADKIDNFMKNFNVKAKVERYLSGPVITRYDLSLEPGVRSSTIGSLVTDLCRDLMVASVRFIGVIPGTGYVGLEVPNPKRKMINLYDVNSKEEFTQSQAALPITLGVSETGKPVVVDLAKAPHLLIAGTTGSGKSAGLNSMLVSLLLKRSPEELRLILIDPKQLEFNLYEDLPHLITPVITDVAEKTSAALRWCVEEMERRYSLIAATKVRKLDEYNEMIDRARAEGREVYDPNWTADMGGTPPVLRKLPYIVVVVEEYADLMAQTSSRKKNENSPESLIARLTQKARAAGIHVILATQTPRADVVTSVIKANLPSRIAYTVQSALDSRIILDEAGAEKLLGYGDMLSKFYGYNNSALFRAHGAFVSNEDVQRVVDAWKQMGGEPEYVEGVTDTPQENDAEEDFGQAGMKRDKVFDEAAAFARDFYARKQKYPTTSDYQANFGLGWARSKKLVMQLIKEGVVEE